MMYPPFWSLDVQNPEHESNRMGTQHVENLAFWFQIVSFSEAETKVFHSSHPKFWSVFHQILVPENDGIRKWGPQTIALSWLISPIFLLFMV